MEMLIADLYKVEAVTPIEGGARYDISLNPGCDIYRGHFPSQPILPGVCSIQTIRECVGDYYGKNLVFKEIRQCRLTTLITPSSHPHLTVTFTTEAMPDECMALKAEILSGEESCLGLKATLA